MKNKLDTHKPSQIPRVCVTITPKQQAVKAKSQSERLNQYPLLFMAKILWLKEINPKTPTAYSMAACCALRRPKSTLRPISPYFNFGFFFTGYFPQEIMRPQNSYNYYCNGKNKQENLPTAFSGVNIHLNTGLNPTTFLKIE